MYETLLTEAQKENVEVAEIPFLRVKGLYCDRIIGIRKDLITTEKACVLAEELGHYHTSAGNILDQSKLWNRKQEKLARRWGYERLVPLDKLIALHREGIETLFDLAGSLGVTEDFLASTLQYYIEKYGHRCRAGDYRIYFEPLRIFKLIK